MKDVVVPKDIRWIKVGNRNMRVDLFIRRKCAWAYGYLGNRRYARVDVDIMSPDSSLNKPYLLITEMHVSPSQRRKKVATRLISMLQDITGVKYVLATSFSEMGEAFGKATGIEER
jgi:hypothetical protein